MNDVDIESTDSDVAFKATTQHALFFSETEEEYELDGEGGDEQQDNEEEEYECELDDEEYDYEGDESVYEPELDVSSISVWTVCACSDLFPLVRLSGLLDASAPLMAG